MLFLKKNKLNKIIPNAFQIYFDKEVQVCYPVKPINMICIADTHGCLLDKSGEDYLTLSDEINKGCDIVVLLGDIRKDELRLICGLIDDKFPIIAVKGNHDDLNQFDEFPSIIDIHKTVYEFNNIRFAGIQGCVAPYKVLIESLYITQEESFELIQDMASADILITHACLYDRDSDLNPESYSYDCHIGLLGSLKYFYDNRCFLNLHGHNHNKSYDDTKTMLNGGKSISIYKVERIIL